VGCICRIWLVCWAATEVSVLRLQLPQADWLRADIATVRLIPNTFPNLPVSIRADMERRGCTVPQPFGSDRPRNVIRGHFMNATRTDWAALCSRGKRSVILIFHGEAFSDVDELADTADSDYLQTVPGARIGFSRGLAVATPAVIRRAAEAGDPKPRSIDHDGIDDAFEGKGRRSSTGPREIGYGCKEPIKSLQLPTREEHSPVTHVPGRVEPFNSAPNAPLGGAAIGPRLVPACKSHSNSAMSCTARTATTGAESSVGTRRNGLHEANAVLHLSAG
jgi:hypothetical protein